MAALLVLGSVGAYFLSLEPASGAYDQALADVALALGERIRSSPGGLAFDRYRGGQIPEPEECSDALFSELLGEVLGVF